MYLDKLDRSEIDRAKNSCIRANR